MMIRMLFAMKNTTMAEIPSKSVQVVVYIHTNALKFIIRVHIHHKLHLTGNVGKNGDYKF